ncbi:GM23288 [Drosophila sechellia]|uniref:GM23288 n=1 Tax=Drosophila sechellia TaxID=7238 RepID=B4IFJ0_DROSE|nr:GM23288 [Drosophila sechellia]
MLMPVREYNKHIAKIPNCKMRQRPTLRATFASLLLLLLIAQTLDPAAASGSAGSGGAAAGAAGPAASGGAGGGSLSSGAPTLIANLTEPGSPGVGAIVVVWFGLVTGSGYGLEMEMEWKLKS